MGRLPPEVEALVERSAAIPRGLAFLHRAPLDAVAAALRARPTAIEETRAALARPEDRAVLLRHFVAARRAAPQTEPERPPTAAPPPDAAELIRRAERHTFGLPFLREAPLEVAAIAFGVHPDTVASARALLLGATLVGARPWQVAAGAASPARRREG